MKMMRGLDCGQENSKSAGRCGIPGNIIDNSCTMLSGFLAKVDKTCKL